MVSQSRPHTKPKNLTPDFTTSKRCMHSKHTQQHRIRGLQTNDDFHKRKFLTKEGKIPQEPKQVFDTLYEGKVSVSTETQLKPNKT